MDWPTIQRVAANRNNPAAVRQLLGKPHLSDASAKAQGRLAQQYVNLVQNPTPAQVARARQKGVTLQPGSPAHNRRALGNTQPVVKPPPAVRPPAQPTTRSVQMGPTAPWDEYWMIIPPSGLPPRRQLREIQKRATRMVRQARSRGLHQYRLIIEMLFDDGTTDWMSTPVSPTTDVRPVWELDRFVAVDPAAPGPRSLFYKRLWKVRQVHLVRLIGHLYLRV